jgi:hypothetical protein
MSTSLAVQQVDIGDALTDMWRSVLLFIPKAVAFVAIIILGWIVAAALRKAVDAILERVGFDRAVERGGIGRALERTRFDASAILAALVYYAVWLFTLQLAFGVWGPNPVSDLISGIVRWLPRAFVAVIIIVVAAAIASAVRDLISGALGGLSYGRALAKVAAVFIIGLGVIAALNQVGIAMTVTIPVLIAVLATIAGILIVGVGGGMIRPMQERWERWLQRAETETQAIRERTQAYTAGRRDAERAMAGEPTQPVPAPGQAPAMTGPGAGQPQAGPAEGGGAMQSGAPPTTGQPGVYQTGNVSPPASAGDDTMVIDPRQKREG